MLSIDETRKSDALWVITSYFNWSNFASKRINYETFKTNLEQVGINLLTVECALFGEPFHLQAGRNTLQVRTASIMWQKERLLNIALEALPPNCRFVAWIDCDLLFENTLWHVQAVNSLEDFGVVQLFEKMVRLPRGGMTHATQQRTLSFMGGLRYSLKNKAPARLGHPGFAWAARRDVLEACGGLYDACIVGGADRVMAHAWFGDYHASIVKDIALGKIAPHYLKWAEQAHRVVRGSVALIDGTVLHLWHGESSNRRYFERHNCVANFEFDPTEDLILNRYGCWEWSGEKPELQQWMRSYFDERREDG